MVPKAGRRRRLIGINVIDDDVTSLSALDDLVLYMADFGFLEVYNAKYSL